MIVNLDAKLAYLAMTKCGSTAFENAIKHVSHICYSGHPSVTHMIALRYNDVIADYLNFIGANDVETTSVIRYPVSWLESWWRYRNKAEFATSEQRTDDITFDTFVNQYVDGGPIYDDIWSQAKFLSDNHDNLIVDHIFRYEEFEKLQTFWEARLGTSLTVEQFNVSQERTTYIAATTLRRFETTFPRDFEIWESCTVGHAQ